MSSNFKSHFCELYFSSVLKDIQVTHFQEALESLATRGVACAINFYTAWHPSSPELVFFEIDSCYIVFMGRLSVTRLSSPSPTGERPAIQGLRTTVLDGGLSNLLLPGRLDFPPGYFLPIRVSVFSTVRSPLSLALKRRHEPASACIHALVVQSTRNLRLSNLDERTVRSLARLQITILAVTIIHSRSGKIPATNRDKRMA